MLIFKFSMLLNSFMLLPMYFFPLFKQKIY